VSIDFRKLALASGTRGSMNSFLLDLCVKHPNACVSLQAPPKKPVDVKEAVAAAKPPPPKEASGSAWNANNYRE
jgi:hypothetical protein